MVWREHKASRDKAGIQERDSAQAVSSLHWAQNNTRHTGQIQARAQSGRHSQGLFSRKISKRMESKQKLAPKCGFVNPGSMPEDYTRVLSDLRGWINEQTKMQIQ